MITEKRFRTWSGFLRWLKAFEATEDAKRSVFRGHGSASWKLETTLERRGRLNMTIDDYYRALAARVRPQIESLTNRTFDVPDYMEVRESLKGYDSWSLIMSGGRFPAYGLMLHARHLGFPSPFLDWTRSPYVAAYFAFAGEQVGVKSRAIYVWTQAKFRSLGSNRPEFYKQGPFVRTHPRHVQQQCTYSLCVSYAPLSGVATREWHFAPQQEVLATEDEEQVWKLILPSSARKEVLTFLDRFNLNAYTLFGSEDALMDTMAFRELDLHEG